MVIPMKRKTHRACTKCRKIAWAEPVCPDCGERTTTHFKGYLAVIDPEKSEMAKILGIEKPGEYAVWVKGA